MTTRVDAVVVGAGAMGTATAWQLARAGRSVVVLEQHHLDHDLGASHGTTRNLSAAYTHDGYQAMLTETRRLWAQLEDESGQPLLDRVGVLQHGSQVPLDEQFAAHRRHGVRSEFVDAAEAERRWPGLRFTDRVLFTRDAGRIRAADALRVIRARAEAGGARFLPHTPVRHLELGHATATAHTDAGTFTADHVVLTAGGWTAKLLPAAIRLPRLRVTQESPAYFGTTLPDADWPGFMHVPTAGDGVERTVYGMLDPAHGLKVGWHGGGPETDPDHRTFRFDPQQMRELQEYVRRWIPGADPDRLEPISCTYTSTPTEDFVLDRRGPLVIGAGFSGHGFKFTPVIGRILADLVAGRESPRLFRSPS